MGEGKGWKWRDALDKLVAASPKAIEPKELDSLLYAKAVEYCKGILEEYNDWVNGNAYGVVAYVIDRSTGRRLEDEDNECWGYLGQQHAEEELEALVLTTALRFGQMVH